MSSVLIIEDDHSIQAILQRIMRNKFGFEIYEAVNGIEGLKIFEKILPDLILLDISMPFMSGIEFLEAIKKEPRLKDIPVLVISANHQRELIDQMIKLGVSDYILKPMDLEATYSRIGKVIDKIKKD